MTEDNEIVSIIETLTSKKRENPFVGLRPYQSDEGHWFFGRDEQVKELMQKLHTSHFLAIVGSSGCGKSSLIRAGVIPKLKGGFLTPERDKWLIAIMRPSGDPLLHLASAIMEAVNKVEADIPKPDIALSKEIILDAGSIGVVEIIRTALTKSRFNLLILVDQFEELFTYEKSSQNIKRGNISFVDLLLSLSETRGLPVYSIITMRSDYFGQCNNFFGLPELINQSQYLVPRLKWQQLREVIEFPIKLNSQQINPGLLDLLANEADRKSDELPVLQHCLMRTYQNWMKDGKSGAIEFKHYQNAGCLHGSILQHAAETYNAFNPTEEKISEYLFRCITEYSSENEPVRRPKKFKVIREICMAVEGATENEIRNVINRFRKNDCAFLTPDESKEITEESVIDISHESLMRQWNKIGEWMKNEQRNADKLYWLSECVTDRKEYLRGIDVKGALTWQQSQRPNNEWAERYVDNLPDILSYIQRSERYSKKRKLLFYGISALAVLGVIGWLITYSHGLKHKAKEDVEKQLIISKANADADARIRIKEVESKSKADAAAEIKIKEAEAEASADAEAQIKIREAAAKANAYAEARINIRETEAKAKAQTAITEGLKQKNIELSRKNDEYSLNDEDFFKINGVGDEMKKRLIATLLQLKYDKKDSVSYQKFLLALKDAATAEKFKKDQPNIALAILKKAYDTYPHPVINASALDFARTSRFYSKDIVFNKSQPASNFNSNRDLKFFSPARQNYFLLHDPSFGIIYMFRHNSSGLITMQQIEIPGFDTTANEIINNNAELSMQVLADGSNFAIVNNEKMYSFKSAGNEITISDIPRAIKGKYYVLAISSQQNILASDDKYEAISKTIRFFDLKTGRKKYDDIIVDESRGYFSKFIFSADGKRLLVFSDAGELWFIDSLGKKPRIEKINLPDIHAANFTVDNKYRIVSFKDRVELKKLNTDSIWTCYVINNSAFNILYMSPKANWDIVLSENWKNMLLSNGQYSIIVQNKNDSVFKSSPNPTNVNGTVVFEKVFVMDSIMYNVTNLKRAFTIKELKWYSDTTFTDFAAAYKYINIPELSTLEKIRADILSNNNSKVAELPHQERLELYNEANELSVNSWQKHELESSVKMYKALLLTDNKVDDKKLTNFRKMIRKKFSLDKNYADRATDYKQLVDLRYNLYNNNTDKDESDSSALATDYGALAFYKLFVEDFNGAIEYSKKGLLLAGPKAEEPSLNWLYTNLALGYLLSKQFPESDKIYVKYRDELARSFLQDFLDLENAGILPRKEDDIDSKIQKVRDYLNDKSKPTID